MLMFAILVLLALSGTGMAAKACLRVADNVRGRPVRWQMGIGAAIPALAVALYGVYGMFFASGPQIFYDSLVYHLALPDLYLRHGRIFPTPFYVYSGIPFGTEMLYLWLLPLDPSGSLCQLLHWSLGLLTAGTIVTTGRRLRSTRGGLWGAALFYTNPMVLMSGRWAAVELCSGFYMALTAWAMIMLGRGNEFGWTILTGIFAGLALGTKYQMIVLLPAIAVFMRYAGGRRAGGRSMLWILSIAVAVAAPWGLKNIFFYGNPVYPFLARFFSRSGIIESGMPMAASLNTSWRDFAGQIWSYSFSPEADNLLSLVYLISIPLFVFFRPPRSARSLLIFAAAIWLPLNAISSFSRYNIPLLAPLSLALGLSLFSFPETVRTLAQGAYALIFCYCGLAAYNTPGMENFWRTLNSPQAANEYLSHAQPGYPNPSYAAFQWANTHLPAAAKLLLVCDERGFYLERDRFPAGFYAQQPLLYFTRTSASSEELYQKLRGENVTHLFINKKELERNQCALDLSPDAAARLGEFWKSHVESVHAVYEMDDDEPALSFYRLVDAKKKYSSVPVPSFLIKGGVGWEAVRTLVDQRLRDGDPKQALAAAQAGERLHPGWLTRTLAASIKASYFEPRDLAELRRLARLGRREPAAQIGYVNLGVAFGRNNAWPEAIDCFRTATELAPNYAPAWSQWGWASTNRKDWARGSVYAEKAVALNPGDLDSRQNLGYSLIELRDWAGAASAYRQLYARAPRLAATRIYWARAEEKLGNTGKSWDILMATPDLNADPYAVAYLASLGPRLHKKAALSPDPRIAAQLQSILP
ncbi:MAG: glycosyltransferase family 39 protein [Elusimicrobiota bacterium]